MLHGPLHDVWQDPGNHDALLRTHTEALCWPFLAPAVPAPLSGPARTRTENPGIMSPKRDAVKMLWNLHLRQADSCVAPALHLSAPAVWEYPGSFCRDFAAAPRRTWA